MAKIIIEMDSVEEKDDVNIYLNAHKMYCLLIELENQFRQVIKYGHEHKTVEDATQHFRDILHEGIDIWGIAE